MKVVNERLAKVARLAMPFWWLLGLVIGRTKSYKNAQVRSILVFDFHLIGDIVLLLPFLPALKSGFPAARIVLVAGPWAKEILDKELVDELISFSAPWVKKGQGWKGVIHCFALVQRLRSEQWDMGIDIRGDIRQILLLALSGAARRIGYNFTGGAQLLTDIIPDDGTYTHLADHNRRIAEYLGVWPIGKDYCPDLRLTKAEIDRAKQIVPYVGFHFGASLPLRRLPNEEALLLLLNWLKKERPVVLFVPPDEVDRTHELLTAIPADLVEKLNIWSGGLRDFIVMLSRAERVFLMDSGPAHIAAALGVHATVIFGPNCSSLVRPLGLNIEIVEKRNVPCRPCNQIYCHNPQQLFCMKGLVIDSNGLTEKIRFDNDPKS